MAPRSCGSAVLEVPEQVSPVITEWIERGASVLYLVECDVCTGALALEDEVRPEAADAVADLHELGVRSRGDDHR